MRYFNPSNYDDRRTLLEQLIAIRQYLKENPQGEYFRTNDNYNENIICYSISNINQIENIHLINIGDMVQFKNGYIGVVDSMTEDKMYIIVNDAFMIKGDKGDKGADGEDGISINRIDMDTDGYLLIYLSNGETWKSNKTLFGFESISATIDNQVGVPQVIATYNPSTKAINLDFKNLKGETGGGGLGDIVSINVTQIDSIVQESGETDFTLSCKGNITKTDQTALPIDITLILPMYAIEDGGLSIDIDETNEKIGFKLDTDVLNKLNRTLVTPLSTPISNEIVGVDTSNSQSRITLGKGLVFSGTTSPYTLQTNTDTEVLTLDKDLWEEDKTQVVACTIAKTDNILIVGLTEDADKTLLDVYSSAMIRAIAQTNGSITFKYFGDLPTSDIDINVIGVE